MLINFEDVNIFCLVEEYLAKTNCSCIRDENVECNDCGICWMTLKEIKTMFKS